MESKVLVVDDEESILRILRIMLERELYEVYTAINAEVALDILQDEKYEFDLIITDVVMPRMNGYELGLHILEKKPSMPILFISGFNSSRELMNLIQSHTNLEYQSKPFGFNDIKSKINKIFNSTSP